MDFHKEIPSLGTLYSARRQEEALQLMKTNPRTIPTILVAETQDMQKQISQNKCHPFRFLIPSLYTFHEFTQVLRRRLQLPNSEAIVLTVQKGIIPAMEQTMQKVYENYRSEDKFLYVNCAREVVYG